MFGIGAPEMAFIAILAIIFIGPAKLPEVARTLGRTFREFQKALDGLKEEIAAPAREAKQQVDRSLEEDEIRKIKAEIMETKATAEIFRRQPVDLRAAEEAKPSAPRPEQRN